MGKEFKTVCIEKGKSKWTLTLLLMFGQDFFYVG